MYIVPVFLFNPVTGPRNKVFNAHDCRHQIGCWNIRDVNGSIGVGEVKCCKTFGKIVTKLDI